MDLASFSVILDTSRSFFNDFVKVSVSMFALISQVAKNGQEPAKNQAHSELLKTWSSKLQFAEFRQPPANAFHKRHHPKTGGGGATPHGAFNPLRARRRPGRVKQERRVPDL